MSEPSSTTRTSPSQRFGFSRFAQGTWVVFQRELEAIFDSSIAYIYAIAFILSATAIFMNEFFIRSLIDLTPFFEILPGLFVIFLPALTMRVLVWQKGLQ